MRTGSTRNSIHATCLDIGIGFILMSVSRQDLRVAVTRPALSPSRACGSARTIVSTERCCFRLRGDHANQTSSPLCGVVLRGCNRGGGPGPAGGVPTGHESGHRACRKSDFHQDRDTGRGRQEGPAGRRHQGRRLSQTDCLPEGPHAEPGVDGQHPGPHQEVRVERTVRRPHRRTGLAHQDRRPGGSSAQAGHQGRQGSRDDLPRQGNAAADGEGKVDQWGCDRCRGAGVGQGQDTGVRGGPLRLPAAGRYDAVDRHDSTIGDRQRRGAGQAEPDAGEGPRRPERRPPPRSGHRPGLRRHREGAHPLQGGPPQARRNGQGGQGQLAALRTVPHPVDRVPGEAGLGVPHRNPARIHTWAVVGGGGTAGADRREGRPQGTLQTLACAGRRKGTGEQQGGARESARCVEEMVDGQRRQDRPHQAEPEADASRRVRADNPDLERPTADPGDRVRTGRQRQEPLSLREQHQLRGHDLPRRRTHADDGRQQRQPDRTRQQREDHRHP